MLVVLCIIIVVILYFSLFEREHFEGKKKIAICITGQTRTNSCCNNYKDDVVLNSIKENFINEEFKSTYDYDIYISTDDLNLNKTQSYFGNKIKNIHFFKENTSIDTYYNKQVKIKSYNDCYNEYKKKMLIDKDEVNEPTFLNNFIILYRFYDVLNMINAEGVKYDYIINTRFDFLYKENIIKYINTQNMFQSCKGGIFVMGTEDVMKYYLNVMNSYGDYNLSYTEISDSGNIYNTILDKNNKELELIKNCNEFQWAEHVIHYFKTKDIPINVTIIPNENIIIYR